jgi:epsilon-lactone hydrolase
MRNFFVDKAARPTLSSPANAPAPKTVSVEAQRILANLPHDVALEDLQAHRKMCARVQQELGTTLLERHRVNMQDAVMAGVPVRVFMPTEMAAHSHGALLLNLHGGGFTVDAGSVTENAAVAAYTGLRIVAARYRLAPEHPFPAAVDDAEKVYRALLADHEPERIGLYGTSAGACLCAQLLVLVREKGLALPHAFGFFTGTADLSRSGDSEFFFRPAGDPTLIESQFSAYLTDSDRLSPRVSPIFSDLAGFPPTLCIAGTRDFMLSQTSLFHRALLDAGVDARLQVFEAMPSNGGLLYEAPHTVRCPRATAWSVRSGE